ncbi:hypothetical protein C2G38_1034344 [Gigaspora rosea]|uniref:Protein kinase domain-containing protein n=1 Tax=Gigaspora rosea TaxID=44941 RepID=A0A397VJM4_9GLOM|nr:hypothetical protein C2G38_1034344 [Gigaspora rosea]
MSVTSSSNIHGIPAYIEPKCFIDPKYKRNKKSDIYSFGVILWEISSGKPPFQTFEFKMALCYHITQGNREKPIKGTPPQYVELYKQCWDIDPSNRLEAKSILKTLNQLTADKPLNISTTNEQLAEKKIFKVLNRFIPAKIKSQQETLNNPITTEPLIKNNEPSLNQEIEAHINPLEITTSSPLCLPDTVSSNISPQDKNVLENIRKEIYKCIGQGQFLKTLELYEEILKNSQHNPDDRKNASTWDLSKHKCGLNNLNELIKALCKNNTLTSLNLSENNLRLEGEKALADVLCKNTILTSLNLSKNNLGSKGGKALADALCKNTTLTSLNLSKNNLGSKGGKALADALCKNITLTSLNLSVNKIGSKGGKALADALYKNSMLVYLDFSYNNLGSEVGEALTNALCKNTTLKNLVFRYNNIGSEGGKAFAVVLRKNTTLVSLDLENNNIESEGGNALANALLKNTTLKYLSVKWNMVGTEAALRIENALKSKKRRKA